MNGSSSLRPPTLSSMLFSLATNASLGAAGGALGQSAAHAPPSFDRLYEEHFDFVWRSLKRLGVAPSLVDDAAQDTFVVVVRRLADFRGACTARTWLFGIVLRVARDYRRRARRKPSEPLEREPAGPEGRNPETLAQAREASTLLHLLLDTLDDDRRAVFVLAELEQMSAPEIAQALDANVNTVYSRLRAARRDFESALARHRAGGFP